MLLCMLSGKNFLEGKMIKLPEPALKGKISLEEAIQRRRSVRNFKNQKLNIQEISQILWAAQGITDEKRGFRAAPSAGALYPMELFIATEEGIFHYDPLEHSIKKIKDGDSRRLLASAAWGQNFFSDAGMTVIICAVYSRVTAKYGKRGIMYTDMEAGHIAQNIHLQAVALNLGSVSVGAFDEDSVRNIIGVKGEMRPIYLIPVGYKK